MLIGYAVSIILTAALSGFLTWYAWRQRDVPGARAYARLALAGCLLALLETLSVLSPSPDQALFWFQLCYTAGALTAISWFAFALEYSGRKTWLSGRIVAGLFVIPTLTQLLLWSNALHGLWATQEIVYYRSGPFWIADIDAQIPGPGLLMHLFYALFLVLAGVVVLFMTAWKMRRAWRVQALVLTGAGFIALVFVINAIFSFLPKTGFDPFTPGMGLSVLLIALAVLRFQFLKRAPETAPLAEQTRLRAAERRALALFLLIFLLLVSGISTGAYLYYTGYARVFRAQVDDQLAAITDLKVSGLQDWRAERLGDAEALRRSPAFAALVQDYFQDPAATQAADMLQAWLDSLRAAYGYERVFLLDTGGVERLASPLTPAPVAEHLFEDAAAVLESGQVAFLDFHCNTAEGVVYLALLAPVYAEGDINRPLGVVVLRIDPHRTLYPYLQQWPTPSETAETLLVRREGNSVLFLNELRFQQDAALSLRYSLAETDILAVKAALGQRGPVEGLDYRGHPVVGHLHAVPDSSWLLVTRIDKAEVYAPLQERLRQTLAILGVLTLACGAGLVNVWRQQQLRHYRGQTAVLDALRESEEQYRLLAETTRDIILLHDMEGRITYTNRAGLHFGGFSEAEALGKPITAFVPPDCLAEIAERRAQRVAGNDTTFLYETEFVDSAGRRVPVEVNSTPALREGKPAQMLIVARDTTARKQAEAQILAHQTELQRLLAEAEQARLVLISVVEDQKRAEEALATERALLRTLVDHLPDSVYAKDTAGRKTMSNPTNVRNTSAASEAEVLGKTDFELFPRELAERYHVDDLYVLQTGQSILDREERITRPGGALGWQLTSKVPLHDSAGQVVGLVGIGHDITDRKRMEEALRESETLLSAVLETVPNCIYVKNLDGTFLFTNRAVAELYGTTPEYMVGKTDMDFAAQLHLTQAEAEAFMQDDRQVIMGKQKTQIVEEPFTRLDGTVHWFQTTKLPISLTGDRDCVLGVSVDITERKRAEEALQESEERFRSLYENSTIGLYRTTPDGRILLANPALVKMLGYPSFEALANRDLTQNGFAQSYSRTRFLDAIEKESEVRDMESGWARPDGTTIFVRESARAIRDAQGATLYYDGTVEDITERRRAEAEVRRNAEQLATTIAVQHALAATLDQRAIWENLGQGVGRLFPDVSTIFISSYDRERAMISAEYGLQDGEPVELGALPPIPLSPPGRGTQSQVIHTRQPLVIAAGLKETVARGNIVVRVGSDDRDTQSALYVPMLIQDEVLGVVQLQSYTPDRFQDMDIRLLALIANTAAVSIQNARLYELAQNEIAERIHTEATLRETQALYRSLFEQSPDAVFILDLQGEHVDVNTRAAELLGYTKPELLALSVRETSTQFDESLKMLDRLLAGEVIPPYERLFRRKDGSLVPVELHVSLLRDSEGRPLQTQSIARDITARKEAERKLQESEAMLRLIFENAFDGISIHEEFPPMRARRLVDCNGRYADMAGRCKQALLEIDNISLFQKDMGSPKDIEEAVRLRLERASYRGVFTWLRPDSKENVIEYTAAPIRMGDRVLTIGIDRDITERVHAARILQDYAERLEDLVAERTRALEEAQERLLRQTRLATLGQIAGSIAHELRTPLGAIKNAAYLINMLRESPDETLHEALDILNQEVANSDRIITSLLNFARPQRPQRQLLDIRPVIERALERLQPPPAVQIEAHIDKDLALIIADATHLEQALGNLLLNALQAMPEGGQLAMRAEQRAALPDIAPPGFRPEHAADVSAGWIVVSVGDTGVGIPPENLEHIFEPLFTTKTTGIGLGLALVRLLVQANDGGIAVTSVPGEGTTFDIYLPVAGMSHESAVISA